MTTTKPSSHFQSPHAGIVEISAETALCFQLKRRRLSEVLKSDEWVSGVTAMHGNHDRAAASTMVAESSDLLSQEVDDLFEAGRDEVFEDGMESSFSRRLLEILRQYRAVALVELTGALRSATTPRHVCAEALRWLGRVRDPDTHAYRRWILADRLNSESILIRDGAILGLASLNDPSVKPYIRRALENEPSSRLRDDLSQLLEQFEHPERGYALSAETCR